MFYNRVALIYLTVFGSLSLIATQTSPLRVKLKAPEFNEQDHPLFSVESPLKGLSRFVFFAMVPIQSPQISRKLEKTIHAELQKIGSLENSNPVIKTSKGDAIDLSLFKGGISLIYEVEDLRSVEGKKLGVIRASLNLEAPVNIQLTKQACHPYTGNDSKIGRWQEGSSNFLSGASGSAQEHTASEDGKFEAKPPLPEPIFESRAVYIWSSNCFMAGSLEEEKEPESLTLLCLKTLLGRFEAEYKAVNGNKPVFTIP